MVQTYEWIQKYRIAICECAGTLCARVSERNGALCSATVWRPEFFLFFLSYKAYVLRSWNLPVPHMYSPYYWKENIPCSCWSAVKPTNISVNLMWVWPRFVVNTLIQAATICITLELLMMGIMVPETCWANSKFCNKETDLLHLVGLLMSTYSKYICLCIAFAP